MKKSSLAALLAGVLTAAAVFGIRGAIEYGPIGDLGWVIISTLLIAAINFSVMAHQYSFVHQKNPNES